jgi:hypothetical protein
VTRLPARVESFKGGVAMAKMLDGMEAMLRGDAPPPAAATLLGMRLASFSAGEALVDTGDRLVAHAVSTCMILRAAPSDGR